MKTSEAPTFRAWDPDSEEEADAVTLTPTFWVDDENTVLFGVGDAAHKWAETREKAGNFSEGNYPKSLALHVRHVNSGKLYSTSIDTDWSPSYSSGRVEEVKE